MFAAGVIVAAPAAETEKLRNDKVAVYEGAIQPGATVTVDRNLASVTVYSQGGTVEVALEGEKPQKTAPKRGDVVFRPAKRQVLRNVGSSEVRFVRVEFLGSGTPGAAPWGAAGLSPNYRVLVENQYARVYNISIPAGTDEPQHSHKDRVVVCLSGSQIVHLMPDGRREPSSLKTDETAWRRGGTHIGQNLGKTNFWAIAVEPK
jgi:quercetin dioxygenase-like cupin family protein